MQKGFFHMDDEPGFRNFLLTANGASNSASLVISAVPLMRRVSLMPGIINSRPTLGLFRMF